MPRLVPVAALFRALNDAAALRQNPLTARFFGPASPPHGDAAALRRIRIAINQALAAMELPSGAVVHVRERRQAAIIRRCDMEGESHKVVASDLGIGLRHFYRELHAARGAFERRFSAVRIAAEEESAQVVDLLELQLQRARALLNACKFDEAAESAQRLWHSSHSDDGKIRALRLLAEAFAHAGDVQALRELEDGAHAFIAEQRGVSPQALFARLRTLQARALFVQGSVDKAAALCTPDLLRHANMLSNARERALWAGSLLDSAHFHGLIGEYRTSTRQVAAAHDLAAGIPLPPALRFRMLLGLADSQLTAHQFSQARTSLRRAYELAVEHNLVSGAIETALTLATTELLDGNRTAALSAAREAAGALIDAPVPEKCWYFFMAAQVEACYEGGEQALELLSASRGLCTPDVMCAWLREAMEADCHLMSGRYKLAARAVSNAVRGFRKAGMLRGLGFSLRIAAQVEEQVGSTARMREFIGESVELLDKYGHSVSLARALELSGRMTGNAAHARRAREMLAAR